MEEIGPNVVAAANISIFGTFCSMYESGNLLLPLSTRCCPGKENRTKMPETPKNMNTSWTDECRGVY
jgi:hypothetical protein